MSAGDGSKRLVEVSLDEASIGRSHPDQEQERAIAIYDLIERNSFAVPGHDGGPYRLAIALHEQKLLLDVSEADGNPVIAHLLSLTPLRRLVKDYFLMCESYYGAIRTRSPSESSSPMRNACSPPKPTRYNTPLKDSTLARMPEGLAKNLSCTK